MSRMDELGEQLAQYHAVVNNMKNLPLSRVTKDMRKLMMSTRDSLVELRGKLKTEKDSEMKQFYDIWEVQKREIVDAKQKEIEASLKKRYQGQADILRTELLDKSQELNQRLSSITEERKKAQLDKITDLSLKLMRAWRAVDPRTPLDQVESVTKNLREALSRVLTTRVGAEFENWEAHQNNMLAAIHRVDETMVCQEEMARKKFQSWLEGDIAARHIDKQARLENLEQRLRTRERNFLKSLELKSESMETTEKAMRQKYATLLEGHDKERTGRRLSAVNKHVAELGENLKKVLEDLKEKKALFEAGRSQAVNLLQKLNTSKEMLTPAELSRGELKSERMGQKEEGLEGGPKGGAKGDSDEEDRVEKEWEKWSRTAWFQKMEKSMEEKLSAINLADPDSSDVRTSQAPPPDKFQQINFTDVFKLMNKWRAKAVADLHKTIEKREEKLEAFYLPFIAKLSLRAAETTRTLHYENKLMKSAPKISPQTYGQVFQSLIYAWDFRGISDEKKDEFFAESLSFLGASADFEELKKEEEPSVEEIEIEEM